MVLWWPRQPEQAQQAEAPQPGGSRKAPEETFAPETAKLLASLGGKQPAGPNADSAASINAQASYSLLSQPAP